MSFETLSVPLLGLIFGGSALLIYFSATYLSRSTDTLDNYWGLGGALGGILLLGILTNLPEVVITTSAALNNNTEMAIGNLLGSVTIGNLVLVILDGFGLGKKGNLTSYAFSLSLVLEGLLVIAVLAVVLMGTQLPSAVIFERVTPPEILIVLIWLLGIFLIYQNNQTKEDQTTDDREENATEDKSSDDSSITVPFPTSSLITFLVSAIAILIVSVLLERTSEQIASQLGINDGLFGATFLTIITCLPDIAIGLATVKLMDCELAMSDIFGGNAFLPVLFFEASLLSNQAILPNATQQQLYLSCLAILLTTIYLTGLLIRSKREVFGFGIDSICVLLLYLLGISGLALI